MNTLIFIQHPNLRFLYMHLYLLMTLPAPKAWGHSNLTPKNHLQMYYLTCINVQRFCNSWSNSLRKSLSRQSCCIMRSNTLMKSHSHSHVVFPSEKPRTFMEAASGHSTLYSARYSYFLIFLMFVDNLFNVI